MLTMIGLALKYPTIQPCRPVRAALNTNATASAPASPSGRLNVNTMVVAPSVAPSANDMMLPESVMKVMPMATQPMNDIVVISDTRLTFERKPGVPSANAANAASARNPDRQQRALSTGGR